MPYYAGVDNFVSGFRDWLNNNDEEPRVQDRKVEETVEIVVPKKGLTVNILSDRMDPEVGDREAMASEFISGGGKVVCAEGCNYLLEVHSGSFIIHKKFVKPKRNF